MEFEEAKRLKRGDVVEPKGDMVDPPGDYLVQFVQVTPAGVLITLDNGQKLMHKHIKHPPTIRSDEPFYCSWCGGYVTDITQTRLSREQILRAGGELPVPKPKFRVGDSVFYRGMPYRIASVQKRYDGFCYTLKDAHMGVLRTLAHENQLRR